MPAAGPRRIVTALDAQGRTRIAKVEEAKPVHSATMPDAVRARSYPKGSPDVRVIWDWEELPARLPADPDAALSGRHPGPRGARLSVTIFPPGWEGQMFWSSRVDILWVMRGELTYRTDGGDEIVVGPGDFVIQNGTNKAFFNRGGEPVHMAAVMLGAVQTGATPPMAQYHGAPELLRFAE